jgi:hypothetical protein
VERCHKILDDYKFAFFSDRVAAGRALDLPVYFGDAGSREVKLNASWVAYVVVQQLILYCVTRSSIKSVLKEHVLLQ